MSQIWKRSACLAAVLSVFLLSLSCSSGPKAPEKGTPGFYWLAAREAYAAGDYAKTIAHLDNIAATDNEYTARAVPWSMVLTSGMAAGYMELADDYAIGARTNKSDPSGFRRMVSDSRGAANRLALQFAESFSKLEKLKDGPITLAFVFPKGSGGQVALLNKVTNGIVLAPADTEIVQKRTQERGVVLAVCRAAGAPDDAAKTADLMKSGDLQVPRDVFRLAMTKALYEESQLYAGDKLDEPQKMAILCQRAQEALKAFPDNKDTKDLSAKIAKAMKKKKA
jgi:hypothetical protein